MAEALWTLSELVDASGGKADGTTDADISGVSIDTRTLRPGDLFVALSGQRDGHDFVERAFAAGAVAALVSTKYKRCDGDGALLRVDDPLTALEAIGRAARARLPVGARVVAVTGSVGKTGTKEMLRDALGVQGRTHASVKSYNNHWGVPLTLARMPRDTQYGVFEIGMNHAGEITPLSNMVSPDVAIITAVEAVHLEHFKSVDEIADAKAEIFDGLKDGGTAILNRDNPYFERLNDRAKEAGTAVTTFGTHAEADCRVVSAEKSFSGTTVTASLGDAQFVYRIGAPGEHLVMNSLAVLAAVKAMGADPAQAAAAFSSFEVPAGRGEQSYLDCGTGQLLLIDESYNANPASMRSAIKVLALLDKTIAKRRIAVLGDMLELGAQATELHAELADDLKSAGVDLVFTAGPNMASLFAKLPEKIKGGHAQTSEELEPFVLETVAAGDAIMVKGSLGSRMGPIVSAIKNHVSKSTTRG